MVLEISYQFLVWGAGHVTEIIYSEEKKIVLGILEPMKPVSVSFFLDYFHISLKNPLMLCDVLGFHNSPFI